MENLLQQSNEIFDTSTKREKKNLDNIKQNDPHDIDQHAKKIQKSTWSKSVDIASLANGCHRIKSTFQDNNTTEVGFHFDKKEIYPTEWVIIKLENVDDEEVAKTAHLFNAFQKFIFEKNIIFWWEVQAFYWDTILSSYNGNETPSDINEENLKNVSLMFTPLWWMWWRSTFLNEGTITAQYPWLGKKNNFLSFMKAINQWVGKQE